MAVKVSTLQPSARREAAPLLPDRQRALTSTREIGLAWGSLCVVGLLIFLPHLLHGGLHSDDWADAAGTLYPPEGSGLLGALSYANTLLSSCRPVQIVFIPLKYLIFGTNPAYLIAVSIVLALLVACLAYAVLRNLRFPWYHAWLIAALTIAYPWYDSTRLWESANAITLAVAFALGGLWVALVGLSHNSWRLHIGAFALYLLSMLTYEITLPLIAVAGLLYTIRDSWRAARYRWGADLVAVVIAGLWARDHTPRTISSISVDLTHLRLIFEHGQDLLARTAYPLGALPHTSAVIALVGGVFAIGLIVYVLQSHRSTRAAEWGLRSWLLLGGAGLLVAALGWAMFIPADPYYTPSVFGVSNRVNGVAGLGLVLIVYAALGVIGSVAAELLDRRHSLAVTLTLGLSLLLGAAYVHVLERHSSLWRSAYRLELVGSERLEAKFPSLPHGTTVFVSNYPANETLGVPIFGTTWGLNGLIKLRYEDDTLRAYPITEERGLDCLAEGIAVGRKEEISPAAYGTARLVDLETGRHTTPHTRKECENDIAKYPAGPLYLTTGY